MTCRCSSKEEHASRAVAYEQSRHTDEVKDLKKQIRELLTEKEKSTVDSSNFIVEDAAERAGHLVLKLLYTHGPECKPLPGCTFEGHKILVFKNATLREAIKS